jgi:hypothetical protein
MLNRRKRVFDDELDVDVNPNLVQSNSHGGSLRICEHHKLGVARRFVEMELVLRGAIGEKTKGTASELWWSRKTEQIYRSESLLISYLSSSPPSLRTMLRRENTVPKISLASSSALRAGRDEDANPLGTFTSEAGREALLLEDVGLGSQRRL